jgi:hypothetical protein
MKNKMNYQSLRIVLIIGLTLMLLLVSCVQAKETQTTIMNTIEPTATLTITPTNYPSTRTPTPTMDIPLETPIATFDWGLTNLKIDVTQGPVYITTHEPSNEQFLYKYANVTSITTLNDGKIYLNLDDLSDNGFTNSDTILYYSPGKSWTDFNLFTSNGARYYYSDLHKMSYDSCMEHFPFTKTDPNYYMVQSVGFGAGRDYCILTSEGRLSILRFDQETEYSSYYKSPTISFVVTTYKKVIPQALIPQPTTTPGPSPTPGRYSGWNLTQKQEVGLDNAAQDFLNAVTKYDKEKIATLMEYPLALDYKMSPYMLYADNKEEFLAVYDELFIHDLIEEFKNASIKENMGINSSGDIWLTVHDCYIFFHPDGKIYEISRSSNMWDSN